MKTHKQVQIKGVIQIGNTRPSSHFATVRLADGITTTLHGSIPTVKRLIDFALLLEGVSVSDGVLHMKREDYFFLTIGEGKVRFNTYAQWLANQPQ
jgi:hypothetical protein